MGAPWERCPHTGMPPFGPDSPGEGPGVGTQFCYLSSLLGPAMLCEYASSLNVSISITGNVPMMIQAFTYTTSCFQEV